MSHRSLRIAPLRYLIASTGVLSVRAKPHPALV